VALFPLVLLIVGLNETSNIIMVALGPFFTMLIGVAAGVQNVDPIYLKVARSFNVKTLDLYTKVVIPAALPIILSAFRLSLGLSLLGVVAVEFLATNDGLGYMIWHSWQILSLGQSMAGLVTTGVIAYALFIVLDQFEKRALPWSTPVQRSPLNAPASPCLMAHGPAVVLFLSPMRGVHTLSTPVSTPATPSWRVTWHVSESATSARN
jgi:NitT/TauT family transport system permease protein